ncbi:hypothetical protein [Roseibium sp. RKSG952]|uniref:hypothetical protein n=1 Tax=Roseibium sp. RKSG952 TaxID=2529384 RepID=UPI0012BB7A10|nr:hypothetical protein [Roseibium sp. RKSG952]MTH95657.1 hypothetical protein [Roseibium sp. RKSG952]
MLKRLSVCLVVLLLLTRSGAVSAQETSVGEPGGWYGAGKVGDRDFWQDRHGIGFSVSSLGEYPDAARIEQALLEADRLGYNMIRTWGTDGYTREVLEAIDRLDLDIKLQAGVYITGSSDPQALIDSALETLKGHEDHVLGISLGNEQLADWADSTLTARDLIRHIDYARSQSDIPLTYNFAGEIFLPGSSFFADPALAAEALAALDYVNVHIYGGHFDNRTSPDWSPEAQVAAVDLFARGVARRMEAAGVSGMPLILGETGWQSAGYHPAATNPANLARYRELVTRYVDRNADRIDGMFFFNLTDETWKGADDYWGLFEEGGAGALGAAKSDFRTVDQILGK